MTTTAPTILQLSKAYGISSKYWHHISRTAGITREDWDEPDFIFRKLLERNDSPLRQRLSDPQTRAVIRKILLKLNH
jgi:hypothetical protein